MSARRAVVLALCVVLPSLPVRSDESAESIAALLAAAQKGDARKQYEVAQRYRYGRTVPKDETEAVRWLRRAAEGGVADAQYDLGFRYELGTGVIEDHAEALRWYRRAVLKHHSGAQNNIGELYLEGTGVAKDCAEAAKWFRLAAREDQRSQLHLADLHLAGCGVPQDDAEALKWLLRAANGWHRSAQEKLAVMYGTGRGAKRDEAEAAKWTRRARATAGAETSGLTLEDWVFLLGVTAPSHLRDEAEKRVRDAGLEAVPPLAAALRTATDGVRIVALTDAVERIGPPARDTVPALEALLASHPADDIYRPFIAAALARVDPVRGKPLVPELERCALGTDWQSWVRMKCIMALGALESPSVPTHIALLKDEDADLRAFGADGLVKGPAEQVRGPLEAALRDTVLEVRVRAAASLLRAVPDAPANALPTLLEGLCKGDGSDATSVVGTLAVIPQQVAQKAVDPLVASLRGSDPRCRTWAAVALGRIDSLRAVPALGLLRQALTGEDSRLRREAASTLGFMGPPAREVLPDLERAGAANPDLALALKRLKSGSPAIEDHRLQDLRLVAAGTRDEASVAYVVDTRGGLREVQQGQRLLDGEIVRVDSDGLDFRGQRFTDAFQATPFQSRVKLFEGGEPAPIAWDPKSFKGGPLSVRLDVDVTSFALLIGQFSGLNVVVEGGTSGPVRLSARNAPWDGILERGLAGSAFGYRLDQGHLRIGRRDRMDRLRPLSSHKWTGHPITFFFANGDLRDIARLFADITGLAVDLPVRSYEPVTIVTHDRPWDETLEMVLAAQGLTWRVDGNRLRIAPPPGR